MGVLIHPTAIIDPGARLGTDVCIGPYAVVEGNVEIGDSSTIGPHAFVGWGTRAGKGCRIFNGASVGSIPQDLKFHGENTTMEIGENVIIREFCTLNRGTEAAGKTKIGSNCALLAYSHVAHDCILGDNIVASNNLALAGHVEVGNHVTFGGFVSVHQFVRIGGHSFLQSGIRVSKDIIPFAMCGGDPFAPRIAGINKVGLERRGYSEERRTQIKRAYKMLFREAPTIEQAIGMLEKEFAGNADVALIVDFVKSSERGLVRMSE